VKRLRDTQKSVGNSTFFQLKSNRTLTRNEEEKYLHDFNKLFEIIEVKRAQI
jgi:hypothetical protein